MQKTCRGCGRLSVTFKDTSNIGKVRTVTGFEPLISYHGDIWYFCPLCWEELTIAAKAIMDIVKDEDIYFPTLVKDLPISEGGD